LQNASWMLFGFQSCKKGSGGYLARGERGECTTRKKVANFNVSQQLLSLIVD